MLEFAAPEIGEVISGRKSFKSAAKSVGKQTLKKLLASGSKQRKIISIKSTKQFSWSRRDVFSNIYRWSCQTTIFGTDLLWQRLETLEESPNCWRCPFPAWTRKISNYLTWWKLHRVWISNGSELLRWVETVFFGIEAQICQRTWLWYIREWRKEKGAQRWVCCFHWNRRWRRRTWRSSSSYLCKQHIALNNFKYWSVH